MIADILSLHRSTVLDSIFTHTSLLRFHKRQHLPRCSKNLIILLCLHCRYLLLKGVFAPLRVWFCLQLSNGLRYVTAGSVFPGEQLLELVVPIGDRCLGCVCEATN